jgi:hypothetical protein
MGAQKIPVRERRIGRGDRERNREEARPGVSIPPTCISEDRRGYSSEQHHSLEEFRVNDSQPLKMVDPS